ncbi:MAG: TetR/AcrR family transcriptional regulator [Candidatus Phaeomarinobacter sp.]
MNAPKRLPARQAILEAAFDILGRDTSASLAEIAIGAGVGRATLHRQFASREDLLRALAYVAIEEMDTATQRACEGVESYGDAMRVCLEALIPLGDRHGFIARVPVAENKALSAEFARLDRETLEMVDGAKTEGVFASDIPSGWIVQAYDHLLCAAWESVRAGDATPSQATRLAWRTLTKGVESSLDDI